jgi:hypothetical protein
MTYPAAPQVLSGDRTLMISLRVLSQRGLAQRLPDVPGGSAFWALTRQAADLVSASLAVYAPAGTALPRPEPVWTAAQVPGFGAGAANVSH